ncbi:DMT family transporter [Rhizobacter sp. Root404]|uniref:DMT family transporter n=1 Tax=Rhizobacter sp. Root404 TaxID=1736528 RepID=UPI000B074586|nr:DMT family transporter [Rhizobacter sp. Root404]
MTVTAQRPGLGIGLVLMMGACFAVSDTLIKYLGGWLPVLFLLWARYAIQAGTMAVWLARQGWRGFATAHPRFQWMRGALLLVTSGMSFFGLQLMPVAEFTALGMLTPVVVTMLAAWVLHEPVSRMRWALVCGGFIGAVIVIRPGSGVFGWAAIFPLLMALCYGCFQVLTSRLASLESPYTTHFYTGFSGAVLVTPLLLLHAGDYFAAAQAVPPAKLVLVLGIGLFATVGHLCLIFAFGHAPMATLMPFIYTQIAFALGVSYLVFRHVPDGWAWVGMAVIAACGAVSAWLNARQASAQRPASIVAVDTAYD